MTPWMAEKLHTAGVRSATQKTLRWPDFAQKIKLLSDLGFCAQTPIRSSDGQFFVPRAVTQAILSPHVVPLCDFSDVTILRVAGRGLVNDVYIERNIEIFAKAKPEIQLTSMAWLTGYTVAIIGNLLLDDTRRPLGWIRPEDYIYNERLNYLTDALKKEGAIFNIISKIY